jgi:hypothetical protein
MRCKTIQIIIIISQLTKSLAFEPFHLTPTQNLNARLFPVQEKKTGLTASARPVEIIR